MKRFLLFSVADYYPQGGLSDVHFQFDTFEEAYPCEKREIVWVKEC